MSEVRSGIGGGATGLEQGSSVQSRPNVILASSSVYRRALLQRLGLPFECVAPGVDEDSYKERYTDPRELVQVLARVKAEEVAALYSDAIVIGSDQIPVLDDEILNKPGNIDAAVQQLRKLRGRTHELLTAVCVVDTRVASSATLLNVHRLTMRDLTDEQIESYVSRDLPLDCAGSYKIEALGSALFSRIEGEDATAIIGLPLLQTVQLLFEVGIDVLSIGKVRA